MLGMLGNRKTAMVLLSAAVAGLGCVDLGWIDLRLGDDSDRSDSGQAALTRISSAQAWLEYFRDQIVAQRERGDGFGGDGFDDGLEFFDGGLGAPVTTPLEDGGALGGEVPVGDFTGTNVQEFGVDEADVIKTDGQYFYMLVGSQLRIIKAYPPEELAELAAVELEDADSYTSELYLNGDRVIAIWQKYTYYYYEDDVLFGPSEPPADGITEELFWSLEERSSAQLNGDTAIGVPYFYEDNDKTIVTQIDVSDRANPVIESEWELDGYYTSSRMLDGVLYVITNQYPYIPYELDLETLTVEDIEQYIPRFNVSFADGSTDEGLLVAYSDFYRPLDPDGYSITTVIVLDTNTVASEFTSLAIMADPGTIYASQEALYITDLDYDYYGDYRETLDIHKLAFVEEGVEYAGSGSVEGRLLNQFSLGESDGYLRVATTTGQPWAWDAETSKNHVFVLGEQEGKLEVVGSLLDLAPGEQIYAARFVGDKGFLVTFLLIDPLFTLDLSDPANPVAVGELKMPGFSEYLHPLDESHLLAIGREGEEDGTLTGRLQISLFDISDFANPKLISSHAIGDDVSDDPDSYSYSYSAAEYNHKAFTYYAAENLLAIPVDVVSYSSSSVGNQFTTTTSYSSGIRVFHVTPEDGITLAGEISTLEISEDGYPAYYGWSRGLFIEQSLYAVTEISVQSASIDSLGEVEARLDIEGSPYFYPY